MRLPAVFVVSLLSCAALAAQRPQHVVVISVDALRPVEYVHPGENGPKIPTLREMVRGGCASPGVTGVFPTLTVPSHTTMVTGRYPAEHGIDSGAPLDPFDRTTTGISYHAEVIKTPTLWDVARKAGVTTGAVYWPATVGAPIDHLIPFLGIGSDGDLAALRAMGTPGLVREVEEQYGRVRPDSLDDTQLAQAAAYILTKYRPNLLLVRLVTLDLVQHLFGPGSPPARATLEKIDAHLAFLRKAAAKAGIEDSTAWVILSDHGCRAVKRQFNPFVVLRALGYVTYGETGKLKNWRVFARGAGGSFALVAKDPNDAEAIERSTRLFTYLASDPGFGLGKVYSPKELEAARAFPGAFLAAEAAGDFMIGREIAGTVVSVAEVKGMHGYDPQHSDMKSALVFYGAGIRPCEALRDANLVNVAPTVADLLGFSMRETRGKVLPVR